MDPEADLNVVDEDEAEATTEEEESAPEEAEKTAKEEALRRERKINRDLKKELAALKKANSDDTAKTKAEEEISASYKTKFISVAAKAAFVTAGCPADKVGKLTRLLDQDDLDVDEDGDVTGLEEQIEAIKADYPQLFTGSSSSNGSTGKKAGTGSTLDMGSRVAPPRKKTMTQRMMEENRRMFS